MSTVGMFSTMGILINVEGYLECRRDVQYRGNFLDGEALSTVGISSVPRGMFSSPHFSCSVREIS